MHCFASTNLFQIILNSLCLFREYAQSVLSESENTPKEFNHIWRMHQKALSMNGEYGDSRVVLFKQQSHLQMRQK
jgi:hypothetical protein